MWHGWSPTQLLPRGKQLQALSRCLCLRMCVCGNGSLAPSPPAPGDSWSQPLAILPLPQSPTPPPPQHTLKHTRRFHARARTPLRSCERAFSPQPRNKRTPSRGVVPAAHRGRSVAALDSRAEDWRTSQHWSGGRSPEAGLSRAVPLHPLSGQPRKVMLLLPDLLGFANRIQQQALRHRPVLSLGGVQ